ncbi:uncharacterized protein TNCV_2935741 [Trichonephila clavipes]|nr:uncharacterized protein TNCV_2935741 [Trichonephila clavipes]
MSSKQSAIFELLQHGKLLCEVVRLINIPCQTVSVAICRLKELAMMVYVQEVGEKILFQPIHNSQNDRIWSVDAPSPSAIADKRQYPKSVMVWGGIIASSKTPLGFVGEGIKINQKVYQRNIIEAVVLPWARMHFGNANWTFQQDPALVHKAKKTHERLPIPASTVSVKLYTYDGKTNGEVYRIQFGIISEANRWTEGVKACQLVAFLRGEAAEVLQTLTDTELLNLNSLYNALDLRFGQKFSKDYAHLEMKTRHQKPEESLQEYALEIHDLNLFRFLSKCARNDFSRAATQANCIDRHSIREARVALDAPCESPWKSDIEKLRDKFQALMAQCQNRRRRIITCWVCGESGHLRSNCPRNNKEERSTKCWGCGGEGHLRINCPRATS